MFRFNFAFRPQYKGNRQGDQEAKLKFWPALSGNLHAVSTAPKPAPPAEAEPPRRWSERLAGALSHRNYRVLWLAALGSTIGTWMQKFAQSWLVFDLTQSNFYLGLDDFLSQLP